MKVVFNTMRPTAAASVFYKEAFEGINNISFYDPNLDNYDVALFMTYDHQVIKRVRESYPDLKIGIIDPRSSAVIETVSHCDFLVVDSIEMEDFWRISKKPIFRYVEYPNIPYKDVEHKEKDKILIGYHGNMIHLECMADTVTPALVELRKQYNVELLLLHAFGPPRGNENWYPRGIKTHHFPWSMENYTNALAYCDIGIVPNNMIHDVAAMKKGETANKFNYNDDDYSLRFKMSSNPGRIIVFGKLGIPVVSDFYPSAIQILNEGRGQLAHSAPGWEHCLQRLIESPSLREQHAHTLQDYVRNELDFDTQNKRFENFLENLA